MTDFGPEAMALEWLLDHFEEHPELQHLRARKRGRVITVESGPPTDKVQHARFRRDTVHLWMLEMPARGGKWEPTPYRDTIEGLFQLLETNFAWMLAPIGASITDDSSDPGY